MTLGPSIARRFVDQMGREIVIPFPPKRIISLVPSLTELLCSLGLYDEVIGITKFCVHPQEKFKSAVKIGGTKKFNFDRIDELKPDLTIGNKEENYEEGILKLSDKYAVWMSDVSSIGTALEMIIGIGDITDRTSEASSIYRSIKGGFNSLSEVPICTVAYIIWKNPIMVAGGNTPIDDMLKSAGFENVFGEITKYPTVSAELIKEKKPDFIFLSSEPFPFKEKDFEEFLRISPGSNIKLVDGELFSWFGSRMMDSPEYFKKLRRELK